MFLLCQTITFWIIILGKAGACYQKSRTDNRSPASPGRKSQNFVIFNDTSRSLDMKQETEYWEAVVFNGHGHFDSHGSSRVFFMLCLLPAAHHDCSPQ